MSHSATVHRAASRMLGVLAIGGALLAAVPAGAPIVPRSILKSYFIEGAGKTPTQTFTSDTEILLTYTAGLAGETPGMGAATALYLYDTGGEPLRSGTGEVVCAPCVIQNGVGGTTPRRRSVVIDDLIVAHGGFGTSGQAMQGSVVMDVTGDADHLAAAVRIRSTLSAPAQPSIVPVLPADVLKDYMATSSQPRVFVIGKLDGISDWDVSDWAILNATYMGGIGNIAAGGGATLEVYQYNEDGSPAGGLTSPVCAPCTYSLGTGGTTGAPRNVALRFPPAPTASGEGFAVCRVVGADPTAVMLEQTDIDSVPGAIPSIVVRGSRALAALGPRVTTVAVNEPDIAGAALALRASPNPAAGEMLFAFDLTRQATVDLEVFDAAGRRVTTVTSGTRAAGHHELRWNRRDPRGTPLAAGIYYGRLRANDGSRVTRLVFLPE